MLNLQSAIFYFRANWFAMSTRASPALNILCNPFDWLALFSVFYNSTNFLSCNHDLIMSIWMQTSLSWQFIGKCRSTTGYNMCSSDYSHFLIVINVTSKQLTFNVSLSTLAKWIWFHVNAESCEWGQTTKYNELRMTDGGPSWFALRNLFTHVIEAD